jgi:hypothetical protein
MKTMNRRRWAWAPILVATLFVSSRAHGGTNVFQEQLIDHAEKALALLTQVESRRRPYSAKEQTDLATDNLATVTLIHRLQETVGEANVRELKNSGKPDRDLLLVSQGCIAVEFLRTSISNYLETGDPAFVGLARDAAVLVKSVRKQLGPRH